MAYDPLESDPTLVRAEPSKEDVLVRVPTVRLYGITIPGGKQIIYEGLPSDEHGAVARVHPDHLERFLRGVEGSKVLREAAPSLDEPSAVLTRHGVQVREGSSAPAEPKAAKAGASKKK